MRFLIFALLFLVKFVVIANDWDQVDKELKDKLKRLQTEKALKEKQESEQKNSEEFKKNQDSKKVEDEKITRALKEKLKKLQAEKASREKLEAERKAKRKALEQELAKLEAEKKVFEEKALKKRLSQKKLAQELEELLKKLKARKVKGEMGKAIDQDSKALETAQRELKAGKTPEVPQMHPVKLWVKKVPIGKEGKIYDFDELGQFANEPPDKLKNIWLKGCIRIIDQVGSCEYNAIEYEYLYAKRLPIPIIGQISWACTELGEAVFDPRDVRIILRFPYKSNLPKGTFFRFSEKQPGKVIKIEKIKNNLVCTVEGKSYISVGNTKIPSTDIWKPEDWD